MQITVHLNNGFWLRFCNARIGWAAATIVNTDNPTQTVTHCVAGITIARTATRDPDTLYSMTTSDGYVISVTDVYPYNVFATYPIDLATDRGESVGDIALNVTLEAMSLDGDPADWFLRREQ